MKNYFQHVLITLDNIRYIEEPRMVNNNFRITNVLYYIYPKLIERESLFYKSIAKINDVTPIKFINICRGRHHADFTSGRRCHEDNWRPL